MVKVIINFIVGSASYVVIKFNEFTFSENTMIIVLIGLLLAFVGLFFEVVGDEQLRRHIKAGSRTLME